MLPVLLVLSLLAAPLMLISPSVSDSVDGANQFDILGGKTLFSPGETLAADADDGIFLVKYGTVYAAHSKIVDSSGATTSTTAVSPIDHTFSSGAEKKGLRIIAPDKAGSYRLVVEFELTSGGDRVTRTYPIKVVDPIVLTAEIKNTSSVAVKITVQFIIDGNEMKIETDHEDIEISPDGTKTVTYKWITDGASGGRHTFNLKVTSGSMLKVDVTEIEKPREFFIGQNSYTWLTIIFVIILVIMIIVLIWIMRKPVKNFGKPKGRR